MAIASFEELRNKHQKNTVKSFAELRAGRDEVFGMPAGKITPAAKRLEKVLLGIERFEDSLPEGAKKAFIARMELEEDKDAYRDLHTASVLLADKTGLDVKTVKNEFDSITNAELGRAMKPKDVIRNISPVRPVPHFAAAERNWFQNAWSRFTEWTADKAGIFAPDISDYETDPVTGKHYQPAGAGHFEKFLTGGKPVRLPKSGFERKTQKQAFKGGVSQAGVRMTKSLAGSVQAAGELVGAERMAEWGKLMAQAADEYYRQNPGEALQLADDRGLLGTTYQYITRPELITQGLVETAPILMQAWLGHITGTKAAKVIGKGAKILPWAGRVAGMGAETFGTTYSEARAEGTEPKAAMAQAILTAAGEGAIEEFTLGKKIKVFKGASGAAAKRGIIDSFKTIALGGKNSYLRGMAEESTQQINQNFWRIIFTDPEAVKENFFARVTEGATEAAASGGIMEMTMTGGFAAAGRAGRLISDTDKTRIIDRFSKKVKDNKNLNEEQKKEIDEELQKEKADILAGKYKRNQKTKEMADKFKQKIKKEFNIDDKAANVAMALVEARAHTQGKTAGQWLEDNMNLDDVVAEAKSQTAESDIEAEAREVFGQEVESGDIWFSRLARVVDEKVSGPVEAEQLRSTLKKAGVKDEEMDWLGITELIDNGGKITPEQIQETIAENSIEIEEVEKTESGEKKPKYSEYTLPGGENYTELLLRLPEKRTGEEKYQNGHYGESNVLAHVRFNERIDKQGENVLFIEEIQSDWHQEGREQGYKDKNDLAKTLELFKKKNRIKAALIEKSREDNGNYVSTEAFATERKAAEEKIKAIESEIDNLLDRVPDAPFKKNWHELAFKRMLRYAAENGFDKIAWTTGAQQVERYSTEARKTVDRIDMSRNEDGNYALLAGKNNNTVLSRYGMTADEVKKTIGKDVFGKLEKQIDDEGKTVAQITGDELTIGGEGMKGFYDIIVRKFADKYVKKYGKRAGETQIKTGKDYQRVHSIDLTDELADMVMGGQAMFQADEDSYYRRQKTKYKQKILDHPVYKSQAEEVKEWAGRFLSYINKLDFGDNIGDVKYYIDGVGKKGYLLKYVAKEGEKGQAWDAVAAEIAEATGRETITDPYEFIVELDRAIQARKDVGGINEEALEKAAKSKDPSFEILASTYEMLQQGYDIDAINDNVRQWLKDYEVDYADAQEFFLESQSEEEGAREKAAREKRRTYGRNKRYKAAVEFLEDGRAAIKAFEGADFSSVVHELGHVFRRTLDAESMAAAEKWAGVEDGNWTRKAEEKFARGFERYLWEGKAPNQRLRAVFAKLRQWLREVYKRLKGSAIDVKLSKEVREVFDKMLSGPAEIHPGEMTFDEFMDRLGVELENYDQSDWMERYRLKAGETPAAAHKRLKAEWQAMQAGESRKADGVKLDAAQRRQIEELEAAQASEEILEDEKNMPVYELLSRYESDQTAKDVFRERLARAYKSGKETGIKRAKKHYKDIIDRAKARKKLREYVLELARKISKPAPWTVDLYYREAIAVLQAGVDPSFRSKKTLAERERIRKFMEKYPNQSLPKRIVEIVSKRALNNYTIAELEELAAERAKLEKLGRQKKKLRDEQDQKRRENILTEIVETIRKQKKQKERGQVKPPEVNPEDITIKIADTDTAGQAEYDILYMGTRINETPILLEEGQTTEDLKKRAINWLNQPEGDVINQSSSTNNPAVNFWQAVRAVTLRPSRIFDLLDGGKSDFSGPMHRAFNDAVNRATDAKLKMQDYRAANGESKLSELGIKASELKGVRIIAGIRYSVQEVMGIYGFAKNYKSELALRFGNNISQRQIAEVVHHCEVEDPRLAELVNWIIQEFEEHFERLEEAFIGAENKRLVKEENYLPMRRQELDYTPHKDEVLNEMMERNQLKRAYAKKGFTIQRADIPAEYQKPIRLDLWNLWLEQVESQEHFIHFAKLVKDLHYIERNEGFREAVKDTFGAVFNKTITDYVSRVANPYIYRAFGFFPKLSRTLRSNAAMSYLAFNLVTVMKQLPSAVFYLADAGPKYLAAATAEYIKNPKKLMEFVRELDPQTKLNHLAMNRVLEELKNANYGTLNKFGEWAYNKGYYGTAGVLFMAGKGEAAALRAVKMGMKPIYWMDSVARTIGWNAVYRKALAEGASEAEAIRQAQNSTLRTQPAAAAKDIAAMYATGSEALNWMLMFSNQLSQIYNMATYDIPASLRNWNKAGFAKAGLGMAALGLSAMMIWVASNRRLPEDGEDVTDAMVEQAVYTIPLAGKAIQSARQGFGNEGIGAIEEIAQAAAAAEDIITGQGDGKDWARIAESAAVAAGVPTVATKRVKETVKAGDMTELVGGVKKKKND